MSECANCKHPNFWHHEKVGCNGQYIKNVIHGNCNCKKFKESEAVA